MFIITIIIFIPITQQSVQTVGRKLSNGRLELPEWVWGWYEEIRDWAIFMNFDDILKYTSNWYWLTKFAYKNEIFMKNSQIYAEQIHQIFWIYWKTNSIDPLRRILIFHI